MAEETKGGLDAAMPALQQDSGPAMQTETASNHCKSSKAHSSSDHYPQEPRLNACYLSFHIEAD